MRSAHATVTREINADVVVPADTAPRMPVVLRYDVTDPYAVSVEFEPACDSRVTWVFARELVSQGLHAPIGDGDVRILPASAGRRVRIAIESPDGQAAVDVAHQDLADFLRESYLLCPAGEEHDRLDLDTELSALLS